jgi:hypothetical protein
MTHKIIICILLLVTVSPVSNMASAGQQRMTQTDEMHIQKTTSQQPAQQNHSKMPVSASHPADAPHGKAARVPHMEEIPHIHRYHKDRVRKKVHHGKLWFLGKAIIVMCQLSLLWIAYMHLTH